MAATNLYITVSFVFYDKYKPTHKNQNQKVDTIQVNGALQ